MRVEKFEGTIESFAGKLLDTPITFSGETEVYENVSEARGSEDWPSENETLKIVNAKLVTAAKAKEYQAAIADVKAAYEKTPEYRREALVKQIMNAKNCSRKDAEAFADSILS